MSVTKCNQDQHHASMAAMEISINKKLKKFLPSDLEKTFLENNLILTKKYPIQYFKSETDRKLSLGPGVEIRDDLVHFSCSYSLDNIHVTQNYEIASTGLSVNRTNLGHLDYKIKLSKSEYKLNEKIAFEIVPMNPGLIYSKLKSCSVVHPSIDLKYDLYWPTGNDNYCKDNSTHFEVLSPLSTKYNIKAQFSSFSWNLNTTSSLMLNCDLELSINPEVNQVHAISCQK